MQRLRPTLALAVTLALAACGSSASPSPAAPAGGSAAPAAGSAAPPSAAAASDGGGATACAPAAAGAAATVNATIKDQKFAPDPVTGKVGDTIAWANGDSAGHTVTLDDGTCTTDTIANGASGALTLTAAGTYTYHCNIHPSMKGTITIS
jgi:plastocyanin